MNFTQDHVDRLKRWDAATSAFFKAWCDTLPADLPAELRTLAQSSWHGNTNHKLREFVDVDNTSKAWIEKSIDSHIRKLEQELAKPPILQTVVVDGHTYVLKEE